MLLVSDIVNLTGVLVHNHERPLFLVNLSHVELLVVVQIVSQVVILPFNERIWPHLLCSSLKVGVLCLCVRGRILLLGETGLEQ